MVYLCWFIVDDHFFKKKSSIENVNSYLFFLLVGYGFCLLLYFLFWTACVNSITKPHTYMVALCRPNLKKKKPNGQR